MKDDLADRMKGYENTFKYKLLRRSYTMIRIDGKAFHTYTKGLERPFDAELVSDMDRTAEYLCREIQGAVCAFVQSDEISILLCDFENRNTSAWFDNSIQKMASVSASMATAYFNYARLCTYWSGDWKWNNEIKSKANVSEHFDEDFVADGSFDVDEYRISIGDIINYFPQKHQLLPTFDSRVWQLPTKGEVENYFIWRQQDTVKNSISSVAQNLLSHKKLIGKNGAEKQEMIFQESGVNWNDFDPKLKRGRMIVRETYEKMPDVIRSRWNSIAPPIFTQDRDFLRNLIPDNN